MRELFLPWRTAANGGEPRRTVFGDLCGEPSGIPTSSDKPDQCLKCDAQMDAQLSVYTCLRKLTPGCFLRSLPVFFVKKTHLPKWTKIRISHTKAKNFSGAFGAGVDGTYVSKPGNFALFTQISSFLRCPMRF